MLRDLSTVEWQLINNVTTSPNLPINIANEQNNWVPLRNDRYYTPVYVYLRRRDTPYTCCWTLKKQKQKNVILKKFEYEKKNTLNLFLD